MVRSSSVGSKLQSQQLNTLQDDRMANIFDEWLNDGWKSSSVTASPQHENLLEKKTTPDWLEWDPLSSASSAKEGVSKILLNNFFHDYSDLRQY